MALLLDHGLRVGEVARLTVDNFSPLKAGKLTFFRPKVNKKQIHKLTPDALKAAQAYVVQDAQALGAVWRRSIRAGKVGQSGGKLGKPGMSERAITERVKDLGAAVGLEGLSAHDCRHYCATVLGPKMPLREFMDYFGWNSPAMAMRYQASMGVQDARKYIQAAANEGVNLDPE
jgi:integrase